MGRAAAVALILAVGSSAFAQQAYRAPRTPDGHPDLQGIWQALNTAVWNIEDHAPELGVPAGQGIVEGGEIPYLPSALGLRQENFKKRLTDDPEAKCYMVGVPRITYMPYPFQIVQQGDQVSILYEVRAHGPEHLLEQSPPEGTDSVVDGRLTRTLGGRDARRGCRALHRSDLVRPVRQLSQRGTARRRALYAHQSRPHPLRSHDRGSESVFAAVEDQSTALPPPGTQRTASGVRVLRVSRGAEGPRWPITRR